jgi:DedD protein
LVKKAVTKAEFASTKKSASAKPSSTQHKTVEIVSVQKLPPVTQKSKAEPSRWFLQAGSFSKKENAVMLTDSLRKQGFPVLLETIQVDGQGTFYRLKVGPELDKKRADSMKAKLDKQNIHSLLIAE